MLLLQQPKHVTALQMLNMCHWLVINLFYVCRLLLSLLHVVHNSVCHERIRNTQCWSPGMWRCISIELTVPLKQRPIYSLFNDISIGIHLQ